MSMVNGRLRQSAVVAIALVSIAAVAACGSRGGQNGQENSSSPFQVTMVYGHSGPVASNAKAEENGMRAAADVINSEGGINGRQVQVKVVDTQADPTKAVSLLQGQLRGSSTPDLIWAGVTSDETLAMLPLLSSKKVLSVAETSSDAINDPSKYPYHFGMQPPANAEATGAAKYLKSKGYTKVGIFYSADALGQSTNTATTKALQAEGIAVSSESYNNENVDLTAPLQKLMATKPQAVYFTSYGAPSSYVLSARSKLGLKSVPFVGALPVTATNTTEVVPAAQLAGVTLQIYAVQRLIPEAEQSAARKTMIKALKKYGPIDQAMEVYSLCYDSLQLVAAAAKQADSTDPAKVAAAMETLKAPASPPWVTFPTYSFSKESHFPAPPGNSTYSFIHAKHGPAIDGMLASS